MTTPTYNLDISNVIQISLVDTSGVGDTFNTGNVVLFTEDTPGETFPSVGYAFYKNPSDVATDFGSTSLTAAKANALFLQAPNILTPGGYLAVVPLQSSSDVFETIKDAILRTKDVFPYFGIITTKAPSELATEIADIGAAVQSLNKIIVPLFDESTYAAAASVITSAKETQTRLLVRESQTTNADKSLDAAYIGRLLSVDYGGSNTTINMHSKQLNGQTPNSVISQSELNALVAAGVDSYPQLNGAGRVFTSGVNLFSDQVVNRLALKNDLQVAGFNYLANAGTKIPQTEQGMDGLKGAYRQVLEKYVRNGYLAPGAWNSGTTFGDPEALIRNVDEVGYYIYSTPIDEQSEDDRTKRKAPMVQIAVKEAGAQNSSSVLVYINA